MADEEITSIDQEEEQGWNQSKRAEAVLQHILQTEVSDKESSQEKRMTVSEAIAARPMLDQDTGRNRARVLFVTTNQQVLSPDSSIRKYYIELAKQLDEIHVFCLVPLDGQESIDRAGTNLWFYQIRSKNWWQLPWEAKSAAKEALVWNGFVRPDVIVGVDPFEAGLAAHFISKKFKRPMQLHLRTDPFKEGFVKVAQDNNWRLRIAKFVLKRAKSIRTETRILQKVIEKKYKRKKDIATLPRFYNFTELLTAPPAFDLHQKYPDYVFIILAFGTLTADSPLHDLFTANHRLLRNPHIGMIVIGDGPAKNLFEEKVKLLGIQKNVVFQKEPEDINSYFKTTNLLVELATDEEADARVLQAAAAGLPVVTVATDLRLDLFENGKSALLCAPEDLTCIYQSTGKFINNLAVRKQISANAEDIARERIHEDPAAHFQATALTIESVLASQEGDK